ncbi:MAG: NAD(P)/FAD-dependent oxidoreductase [Motiliproteus sp.]|nr:NAD(P)/FAD-dependent oxidoreductase [Motiliproteus sp.]MCW9054345.1 NAD(P)/FAD-dependent oxidoreductase [Motiliproteus sp.]
MENIVIVGGGAGGLELATKLGHKLGKKNKAKITLVDRNRVHIWKPLLHEVATGTLDTNLDGVVYRVHSSEHYYEFQHGTLADIDRENKQITLAPLLDEQGDNVLPERTLPYSQLILAIGSVSNDFSTPGVAEHCSFLDSRKQAEKFHKSLLNHFLKANLQNQQSQTPAPLKLAIVGGGATGVELSAELFHVVDLLKSYGIKHIDADSLSIKLIEAGPRILPALPERIAQAARVELVKLGVEVLEHTRIVAADKQGFLDAEGDRIDAELTVWAAGIKAPDFLANIGGLNTNAINQIVCHRSLKTETDPHIYAIGDCAAVEMEDGSRVPPRAQSAHQMADLVFKNILREINNEPLVEYTYTDYGSLVNLSRFSTVGSLMGNLTKGSMFIEGRIARLVYISLYRLHQIAIHGYIKGLLVVIIEKLSKVIRPKMKLH